MSKHESSISSDLTLSILQENTNLTQRKTPKSFLSSVSSTFLEFSKNTSIHGFKYLGANQGCTLEKIWWITVLCICVYMCTGLTLLTLKKRAENPVFVSFRQSRMHIWDIPFPAITICPASKIKATKYNLTFYSEKYTWNNLTTDELKHFMDMNVFCKTSYKHHFLTKPISEHNIDEKSINHFIQHSLSLEDILEFCKTVEGHFQCKQHFSPILTSSGVCFSFNMLDKNELFQDITYQPKNHVTHRKTLHWNPDDNYIKTLNDTVPIRLISVSDGLYFGLRTNKSHVDELCEKSQGYKIIFHHPAETPSLFNRYLLLSTKENYNVWITPAITMTSKNLRDYLPHRRGCYFAHERQLKFYKIYTELNCRQECVANYTLRKCGCVPFFAPRETTANVCGLSDMHCMYHSKEELFSLELELEVLQNEHTSKNYNLSEVCNCLPSCTSVVYNIESIPEQPSTLPSDDTSNTFVYMSFKNSKFITMERNELFSNVDFWASCGGLFGLFTGFSVVSLAEIIYFATLKLMCNFYKMRKKI